MNGKLMLASSPPIASFWARRAALLSVCGISSMGKFCVSTAEESLGSKGARMRRSWSQTTPRKKGCCLISVPPPRRPRRLSASQIKLLKSEQIVLSNRVRATYLRIKCSASGPICWSGGKCKFLGQSTILRYVSWGSSAQNGGQPIKHSNMMVPTLHQSQR